MASTTSETKLIKVLMMDDNTLVRKGIAELMRSEPDLEVVGETDDIQDALKKATALEADVILVDIKMHGCDGIEAIRTIREELPQVKIIALTISEDEEDLLHAVKNGVQGYLLKNLKPEELFGAIRGSLKGEAALSPLMISKMLVEFSRNAGGRAKPLPNQLTEREREVLRLVAMGASNSEISARLSLSKSTVTNHVHNIRKKLHLQSRVQAALYAIDHGLLGARRTTQDSAY